MKYVLGVAAAIVVAVAVIIMIVNSGPSGEPEQSGDRQITLTDYADSGATASYTVYGNITGEDNFQGVRISVSRNLRTIEVLNGYDERVAASRTYSNTESAFEELLHALSHAGFSRRREARFESMQGVCPFGRRYSYELDEGSEDLLELWSTSCNDRDGNFGGDDDIVRKLFQAQIPDYREVTRGVNI